MTSAAAHDVVQSSQRLMDGMLDAEDACFVQLDQALQRTADATRDRIIAAHRLGPAKLKSATLLPDERWLADVLLPPISELIALARERAVVVVARQMQSLATLIGAQARDAATAGKQAARTSATDIEQLVYRNVQDTLVAAASVTRSEVIEQRRIWVARNEDLPALIARVCSAERVGLPSASRGAVWTLRGRMHATARAASVDTCNALLLSGMRGWNDHPSTEPA